MKINYSIIIPVYNTWHFLDKLLKSLPSRNDIQILIIDDCSTQDTEIQNSIKQTYPLIEWLKTERNLGAGHARNLGLENAKGKWVLFADSDDYFTNNINSILEDYIYDESDIVYLNTRHYIVDKDYNIINKKKPRFTEIHPDYDNIVFRFTEPWAKLIKRDFIISNKIKFQETIHGNDIFFSTLCDYYMKSFQIDKRLAYIYINRHDSLSHDVTLKDRLDRLKIIGGCKMFLYERGIRNQYWTTYLKNQYYYIIKFGSGRNILKAFMIAYKYKMFSMASLILCNYILNKTILYRVVSFLKTH